MANILKNTLKTSQKIITIKLKVGESRLLATAPKKEPKEENKPLDNSENNNKINKENKQGDNDGRQQQQSNSETYREQRNEQRRQAFAKIQGLDSRRLDGGMSVFDKRRGGNSSQDGLVEYTIEAKPEENKQGDNDGRQEQSKQRFQRANAKSTESEAERRGRKEKQERAINRIREWMDGGRHNGFISRAYGRRGDNSSQDGLVEYTIEAKLEENEQGDNDGRQEQSNSERDKERNRELRKQAITEARNYRGSNVEGAFIRRGSVWGLNEECKAILQKSNLPTFNVR